MKTILTELEIKALYMQTYSGTFQEFARAIESKIIEKLGDPVGEVSGHQFDVGILYRDYSPGMELYAFTYEHS